MASYYEHFYAAFGKECLQAGFMRSAMRARATAVMATAQSIAPVDTGEYVSSFEVSDGITTYGGPGARAYGRVTNTAPHALWVEMGGPRTPKYRTLGRALFAAGGSPGDVDIKGSAKAKTRMAKSVGK